MRTCRSLPGANPFSKRPPAVTHADGPARVHTVAEGDGGRFWRLPDGFGRISGMPIFQHLAATAAAPNGNPMSKQQVTGREAETVRDVVDQMAKRQADKLFLISPDTKRELTFREFRRRARNL